MISLAPLMMMSGCVSTQIEGTETVHEVCMGIGSVIPSRSYSDTQQTQDEIGLLMAGYDSVCDGYSKKYGYF